MTYESSLPPFDSAFPSKPTQGQGDYFRFGIALPTPDTPGVVQVEATKWPVQAAYGLLGEIEDLARVYKRTPLRGILQRIGVKAEYEEIGRKGLRADTYVGRLEFPSLDDLNARLRAMNERLPSELHFPLVEVYNGGLYPAERFLGALTRGKVLMANGSNEPLPPDEPLAIDGLGRPPSFFGAHEYTAHLLTWMLRTWPNLREHMGNFAQVCLEAGPAPSLGQKSMAQEYMDTADGNVSYVGLGVQLYGYPQRQHTIHDHAALLAPLTGVTYNELLALTRQHENSIDRVVEQFPHID